MSLLFVSKNYDFKACDVCNRKPGSPRLCDACLERRALLDVARRIADIIDGAKKMRGVADALALQEIASAIRLCAHCADGQNPECPEHGR
jgi:hypothetical protein